MEIWKEERKKFNYKHQKLKSIGNFIDLDDKMRMIIHLVEKVL